MSNIKPSSHGIVVENKESGLRYASTDANFDPQSERKVRDLRPGESIFSYPVKSPSDSGKNVLDYSTGEGDTAEASTAAVDTVGQK